LKWTWGSRITDNIYMKNININRMKGHYCTDDPVKTWTPFSDSFVVAFMVA